MVQNEAETANRQEADPPDKPQASDKPKALTLSDIESVLQKHAEPIAAKYRVKPHQFKITLALHCRGVMMMQRGPVVQITLLWPDAASEVNTLLREAFKMIHTRGMIDSWAVEPMALIMRRNAERKEWFRETFGDEFEIMADLLPRSRLRKRSKVSRVLTLTDKETGISVSENYDPDSRGSWEVEQEMRVKLSRIVRAFEAQQAEENGQE